VPSFEAGILFVVLFSVVTGTLSFLYLSDRYLMRRQTAAHLVQALRSRVWFLLPTVVTGGFGEIAGWVGRLWGNQNPTSMKPYIMQ